MDERPAQPNTHSSPQIADIEMVYQTRLTNRKAALDQVNNVDRRIADLRMLLFIFEIILCWAAFWSHSIRWFWVFVPLLGFLSLVVWHERIRRSIRRITLALEFYERGLRNVGGTWQGTGNYGASFLKDDHPFAADLDLFGVGSLYERICLAKTRSGEETLSTWLLSPADSAAIRQRQQAVAELRPMLDLREDLEILGADVQSEIDPQSLIDWGNAPRHFGSRQILVVAIVLATLALISLSLWAFTEVGSIPFAIVVLLEVGFVWIHKNQLQSVVKTLERRSNELKMLSRLVRRIESETFQSTRLAELKIKLGADGELASVRISQLARLLNGLEARQNQAFAPLAALLLWSTFFSLAIESWRLGTGPSIGRWLSAIGEFEALLSIASFAYESPSDPFPEIEDERVCFEAVQVAHPLLSASTSIANDLSLGGTTHALLISGSNMSGKSTLLRTVGINTVLALAGAPVRAKQLRVSVFSIGATLRIQDSLQQGRSRFFAELTRLRTIVDLSKSPRPLLFLLDEIFHGTNSHDRVAGAGGVVRGLLDQGAIGLVTTHDLALAEFARELAPRVENMHFEDQFVDGVMSFDYQLKPGVVTHSNALALMRAVGLEI